MKKCLQCSKNAVLHITEIRDNEARAVHLCESCAQLYLGGDGEDEQGIADADIAEKISQLADDDLEEMDNVSCPNCGIRFNEFRAKGRLSCPQCYDAFGEELLSLLENIHGDTRHTGKFPRRDPGDSQRHYELIKLRNELRQAVETEDYETAATLRDRIQALETNLAEEASPDA
jgi:protein arginine kinase activator